MKNILFLITLLFTGLITNAQSTEPALVGYWQNWWDPASPHIQLDQVDSRYNIIDVSFAVPKSGTDYNMQFIPDGVSQTTFITQIRNLQNKGKKVIISIGGATAPISLSNTTERDIFITSMGTIIDTYGFDGIDIDFEGSSLSVTSGTTISNPTDQPVINLIYAVKQIMKNYYVKNNKRLLLTMAPETAFVQGGMSSYGGIWGAYLPVIHALRDSIEILHVQLYNSGTIYGIDGKIYSEGTADFIVAMTEAVIKGFNTKGGFFTGLPASKVAAGLPACSGASSGFVSAANVQKAINYLRGTGTKPGTYILAQTGGHPTLRGMMTWSINWDKLSTCGTSYEFAQNFQTIFGAPVALATPAQPVITNILTNSATASWTAVSGATSYKLRYKPSSSTTYVTVAASSTTFSLTGLTAGTSYDCSVQAVNATSSSAFGAAKTFTTTAPALATPAQPVITNILTNSTTASWTAVSGATSYKVRYKSSSSTTYVTVAASSTTFSLTGLTAGTSYDCSVQAVNATSSSAFGTTKTFTTIAPALATPAQPVITNILTNSITASWTAVNGATSYKVRYKPSTSSTYVTLAASTTTLSLTGLTAGTSYDCSVQAVNATSSSAFGATKTFTTTAPALATPAQPTVTNILTNSATASWTAVSGATSYKLRYKPSTSSTYITLAASTTTLSLTGLTAGTGYDCSVQAVNASSSSAFGATKTFTTTAPVTLAAPAQPTVTNILANSATASWTAVSGATSYKLRYKPSSSTTYVTVAASSTTFSLTGLTAGTSYDCSVQAVNATSTSAFGAAKTFTTTAPVTLAAPAQPTVTNILANSATVSWVAVSGATSYNLRYKTTAVTTYTTVAVTSTSYNLAGLTAGTGYDCSVQAVNATSSAFGTTKTFTTTVTSACTPPASFAVTNITANTALATWNPVSGAFGYNLVFRKKGSYKWINRFPSSPSLTIYKLASNTTYEMMVRTKCSSGTYSPYSAVVTFTTIAGQRGEISDNTVEKTENISTEVINDNDLSEELSVEVYPNPTTDFINLRTNITMDAAEQVTLFNTAGQLLFMGNISGQVLTIPVAELAPGLYFLKVRDKTIKFIKK